MHDLNVEKVFLGSIFHDIGKFFQRTKDEMLKKKIKEEYSFHISEGNVYSPRHQEYGAYFYKNSGLPYSNEIEGAILNHHSPVNLLSKLIQIADHISANERTESELNSEKDNKIRNMKSMLSLVSFGEERKGMYKKISKLSDYNELLEKEEESVEKSYSKLWKEFEEIIKVIANEYKSNDYEKLFERIYYVLKEYTSNVPSAFFYSEPDISLFSHLITTAGIAVSIFKQFEEELKNGNESVLEGIKDQKILGIIKGDISGIQSFIYNVSQEGALKKLRGRSFYLTYLLEIIAKFILKNEGLTIANILYNGGGHFYLIVPAKTIDKLEEYQKQIDKIIFNAHGTELSVNLVGEKISPKELNGDIYGRISKKMEFKKYKKFNTLSPDLLFEAKRMSKEICPYCRKEMKNDKCEFCESFADLGDRLVKAKSLKINEYSKTVDYIKTVEDIFKAFGYEIKFFNEIEKDGFVVLNKENVDFRISTSYIKSANYVLKDGDGTTADLETIASKAKGIKKWGVLRGDVDNLGRLFGEGLGENPPISKKVSLSQEIEIFFGKFLEDLTRKKFKNCSVVYSGGDDFFILGPWSDLPYLAKEIREEFRKYSGYNPDVSISMSIEIAPAKKYSVFKVANASGENLDRAKDYKRSNGKTKDALYFLQDIIGWEEFDDYTKKKNLMVEVIEKNVTKRYIYVLRDLFGEYLKSKNGYFKVWKLYYYFTRLVERYEKAKDILLKLLNDELLEENNKLYKHLYSLTYWVEYEKREG